jgi:glycosyltransferase involved in cell wall biosynthesis
VVLTVHDVSFCAHPEWFGWREGLRRRTMTRLSAKRAHTVLTVSDFSKGEIVRRLGVAPGMVRRVYNGLPRPAGRSDELPSEAEQLVLYVGSILNRRHVFELIEAFGAVAARHPRTSLAIVGDNRTYPRQNLAAVAERQELGDRVRLYDYVDEDLLAKLYRRARVFAFLSEYEGFGLTPLEALAAGVAPVLLDTPIAREICGEAACYVPDTRVSTVAPALERLLVEERERRALLEHAPAVLSRYSWERAGRETLEALIHTAG